jgi:hypothetical protein
VANAGVILPLLDRRQRLGSAHPALLERAIEMVERRVPIPRQSAASSKGEDPQSRMKHRR